MFTHRLLLPRLRPGLFAVALALPVALLGQALPSTGNLTPASPPVYVPAKPAASGNGPDIHDIHNLVPLTFWEQHGMQIILGSVAGVLVLAGILSLVLRKKPQVILTAYQKALRELQVASTLHAAGQDKNFAIAASDAVRRYLENAYKMPAPERTTEEFLQEAARHAWLQGELTTLLKRFLEFCDLAKFAGQQFGEEERGKLLASARAFLDAAEKMREPAPAAKPPAKVAAVPPAKPTLTTP